MLLPSAYGFLSYERTSAKPRRNCQAASDIWDWSYCFHHGKCICRNSFNFSIQFFWNQKIRKIRKHNLWNQIIELVHTIIFISSNKKRTREGNPEGFDNNWKLSSIIELSWHQWKTTLRQSIYICLPINLWTII